MNQTPQDFRSVTGIKFDVMGLSSIRIRIKTHFRFLNINTASKEKIRVAVTKKLKNNVFLLKYFYSVIFSRKL